MRKIILFFKKLYRKNKNTARIELGPLKMFMEKTYTYHHPHELSLYIPRVEIRERVETPFFTKTKETLYNSITIVDAPQHPLADEGNDNQIIEIN